MTESKIKITSIIGNIGAGKTTRLDKLRKQGVKVIEEDVGFWIKTDMLPKLYKNKKIYSYPFQHLVLLSNFLAIKKYTDSVEKEEYKKELKENPKESKENKKEPKDEKEPKNEVVMLERSIVDARYVFVDVLHEDGDMEDDLYNLYCWQYDSIYKQYLKICLPNKFVYLKTTPQVCLNRIQKRGRECEKNISLDYLQKLHNKYEALVKRLRDEHYEVEIIDADEDMH